MKPIQVLAVEGYIASFTRRKKNYAIMRRLLATLLLGASAYLLSGCGAGFKVGEVGAVKEANELAIACKTNEALAAVDRASGGGGLGASIGDLHAS